MAKATIMLALAILLVAAGAAWMFRFETSTGGRVGATLVHDRWTQITYFCVPSSSNPGPANVCMEVHSGAKPTVDARTRPSAEQLAKRRPMTKAECEIARTKMNNADDEIDRLLATVDFDLGGCGSR